MEVWKSPRQIQEDTRLYVHQRLEAYMQLVDKGELTQFLALSALREEIEYNEEGDL